MLNFFFYKYEASFCRAGNSGRLTWVKHSSRRSSATHSCQCLPYFHVSKQCCCCQRLGILTCAQTLMHAIAHGGCMDTVKESAMEVDTGRKIPCHTGDSNPRQYCAGFSVGPLYPRSYPRSPSLVKLGVLVCK